MVAGITDKELSLLIGGRWFDDATGTPGWWRKVEDPDGEVRLQLLFPSKEHSGWRVTFGDNREGDHYDGFEEALARCDSRAATYKILPADGIATKQEGRFAAFSEQIE